LPAAARTQQNAALVDETAAAATSLLEHTDKLVKVVRLFKLGTSQVAAAVASRAERGEADCRSLTWISHHQDSFGNIGLASSFIKTSTLSCLCHIDARLQHPVPGGHCYIHESSGDT
jgi:hypothetical protein